ncbi:MAG: FAD-dependent oxidoreductase [Cellulosilyticaceae bacterium]
MNKIEYPQDVMKQMQEIVDGCMGDADAYCVSECPMHTDVKSYIKLIGEGKNEEALKVIREKLFLPGTLGRICAHPCEEKCKRGEQNEAMAIAALKRFVADTCDAPEKWDLAKKAKNGKKVAVIGAGPAGAQSALDLIRKGYEVTVFEKLPVVGGMMYVGIPEYRLPRTVIEKEYEYLQVLGVEFKMGVEVGKDIAFANLERDFDAIVVAVGAHIGNVLPIEGSKANGVLNAVDFLREVALTRKYEGLGKKLVVIGGGNVAIDVARSARRVGAEEVILTCLERTHEEMPAHGWEIEEAVEEGVTVKPGYGPVRVIEEDGKVVGYEMKKCLSIFDAEGKFNPQYDENCVERFDVDNVCFAIGQGVDGSFAPELETQRGGRFVVDQVTLQATNNKKVFVAGDASGRAVIVIEAMAEGRKAAESVDRFLNGKDMTKGRELEGSYKTKLETTIPQEEKVEKRRKTVQLDPSERIKSFIEVDNGFTKEAAVEEASRCLQCECRLCMKECTMLNEYCHCPKDLFQGILDRKEENPVIPYSCNMCNQCTLACPKDYKMPQHFMKMRLRMVEENGGKSPMPGHKAIEMHQLLGFSKPFNTTQAAPSGKTKRVFIPGCSLPSYAPEAVGGILSYLQEKMPDTGAILKCCGKPTKAVGQQGKFKERYAELQREIDKLGAEEIIVACQSCYLTMNEYSPKQKVRSLWEVLPEIGLPQEAINKAKNSDITFAIHDSCSTRDITGIHDGIRWIMNELGYSTEEPPHTRETAMCCGFGGMVVPANPEVAQKIMNNRTAEVNSDYMVTYCAACRESMCKGGKKAEHILKLIFGDVKTSTSEFSGLPNGPVASWKCRYESKRKMIKATKASKKK